MPLLQPSRFSIAKEIIGSWMIPAPHGLSPGGGVLSGGPPSGTPDLSTLPYNADCQHQCSPAPSLGVVGVIYIHKCHSDFQDSGAGWYHQDPRPARVAEASRARCDGARRL